VKTDINVAML